MYETTVAMKFNQYTWELYKTSQKGKEMIDFFANADGYTLFSKFLPSSFFIPKDLYEDWLENLYCYSVSEYNVPASLSEAKDTFCSIITLGVTIEGEEWLPRNDFKKSLDYIQPLSYILSRFAPEYFFPYLFLCRIFELNKIADTFYIDLPTTPHRSDYKGRCMYYWDLCEIMYNFRIEHDLSYSELWAFLYDYAVHFVSDDSVSVLPKPSQAWFIGGKIYPEDRKLGKKFWQSNPETKKGDILVHYETNPISAITCIEIAKTDGVIDPFFHYYANTHISNRIEVPHISLKELKGNRHFCNNPLVRKNFRGVNGQSMTSEDYTELLRIIGAKGFDIGVLPKLFIPKISQDIVINHERDVETNLLEPLLNSMGWKEGSDFVRQLPIQAGRGHSVYPDYALHYSNAHNEENARVLIEAKLYMKSNQDIGLAFLQARSYARLLLSKVIVLCDKHCLIVYRNNDGIFDRDKYEKYYWNDLKKTELFNRLKQDLS